MGSVTCREYWRGPYPERMATRFLGLDLAAQDRRTGLAVLCEQDQGALILDEARTGVDDGLIAEQVRRAEKVGVDVPLGWPRRFVELLAAHAQGVLEPPASTGDEWRRSMAMRETDRDVHARTGVMPLSVSTDRIAHPALRWAGIEARLRDEGVPAARDGSGRICEVYPAATLRLWGLPHRGYKGVDARAARRGIVDALGRRFPRLRWNGHDTACVEADDALDAVIAALMAREVSRGRAAPAPAPLRESALSEGWIWLPE